jgi:hypothetical protein
VSALVELDISTMRTCLDSYLSSLLFGRQLMSRSSQPNILKLFIATIKRINKLIIKLNQIQLNMHLFKYLGEKLNKVKLLLKPFRKPPSRMSMSMGNDQNKVLNQLYLVTRHVEDLVQRCICRETSWLDVAIHLVDVKENVMEIQLDLPWWNLFFKIINLNIREVDMNIGKSQVLHKLVNAMKKKKSFVQSCQKKIILCNK